MYLNVKEIAIFFSEEDVEKKLEVKRHWSIHGFVFEASMEVTLLYNYFNVKAFEILKFRKFFEIKD